MSHTSVSLLDRACNGSGPESWTRLASIYTPLLQVWLRKYALQPSDVDDLVQDVLVTVSRELPTFEHSGRTGAFRSWLRMILVHRLQNFWRSRKHRPDAKGGSVEPTTGEGSSAACCLWFSAWLCPAGPAT